VSRQRHWIRLPAREAQARGASAQSAWARRAEDAGYSGQRRQVKQTTLNRPAQSVPVQALDCACGRNVETPTAIWTGRCAATLFCACGAEFMNDNEKRRRRRQERQEQHG
jgi:hypothetical protein